MKPTKYSEFVVKVSNPGRFIETISRLTGVHSEWSDSAARIDFILRDGGKLRFRMSDELAATDLEVSMLRD